MTDLLSALRLRARAISLAAAVLYLLPVLAAMIPAAPASAADAAFAAAVRAGIICTTPDPSGMQPTSPAPAAPHSGNQCGLCVTVCATGSAAPPPAVAVPAHPRPGALVSAPHTDDADAPGLRRPASDVAARAPPAAARV
jgi:outer membrane biosynthesis protein TonB